MRDAENNPKQAIAEDSQTNLHTHTHTRKYTSLLLKISGVSFRQQVEAEQQILDLEELRWSGLGQGKGSMHHTRVKHDRAVLSCFSELFLWRTDWSNFCLLIARFCTKLLLLCSLCYFDSSKRGGYFWRSSGVYYYKSLRRLHSNWGRRAVVAMFISLEAPTGYLHGFAWSWHCQERQERMALLQRREQWTAQHRQKTEELEKELQELEMGGLQMESSQVIPLYYQSWRQSWSLQDLRPVRFYKAKDQLAVALCYLKLH